MAFRIVDDKFWTDPKVRDLDRDSRYLFLYFVTNPHAHFCGLYYLPLVLMLHETGFTEKAIRYPIDTLSGKDMVYAEDQLVWVVNMLRYQAKGPKAISGIVRHLKSIHNSELVARFVNHYLDILADAIPYLPDTLSTRYPIEEEKRQKEGNESPNAVSNGELTLPDTVSTGYPIDTPSELAARARVPRGQLRAAGIGINKNKKESLEQEEGKSEGKAFKDFMNEVKTAWNSLSPPTPKIRDICDDRLKKLKARYNDETFCQEWRASIDRIRLIPGITGGCENAWVMDFDAWLRPAIFRKLIEGGYDHWGKATQKDSERIEWSDNG